MIEIKKKLTTKNCYINKNKPKYIVIHETDNWSEGAGAERHAQAMYNGNLKGTVHYYPYGKENAQKFVLADDPSYKVLMDKDDIKVTCIGFQDDPN